MARTGEYIKKHDKYKKVYLRIHKSGDIIYQANAGNNTKHFDNDRDAAKCVDLWLIKNGKEPVNILVRK